MIGRSRGGWATKVHALTDVVGRPYALMLTPGNVSGIKAAAALLEHAGRMRYPYRLEARHQSAIGADDLSNAVTAHRRSLLSRSGVVRPVRSKVVVSTMLIGFPKK